MKMNATREEMTGEREYKWAPQNDFQNGPITFVGLDEHVLKLIVLFFQGRGEACL